MRKIITDVQKGSLFEKYEIVPGDEIIEIDRQKDFDILDFMILTSQDRFVMTIEMPNGKKRRIHLENEDMLPVGASFQTITIDRPRECKNNCIFCFMDQMPKGLRDTLYFKDDDYRLSFLCGNYITLTNVTDQQLDRIIRLRLDPLNISVHTTDPELRKKMMHNKNAGNILHQLHRLYDECITMNIQLVLVPGYNDRDALRRTLEDILEIGEAVASLSCVPVGLSRFRDHLAPIEPFDGDGAGDVIDIVDEFRERAQEEIGEAIFHASDEFYILSGREFPEDEYYGEYLQYENGVGMARSFLDDMKNFSPMIKPKKSFCASVITGELGYEIVRRGIDEIENLYKEIKLHIIPVKNEFFGGRVSASGLVTGSDIIRTLEQTEHEDTVIIPANMLKDDEDVFLDDISVRELEEKLGVKILLSSHYAKSFLDLLAEQTGGTKL